MILIALCIVVILALELTSLLYRKRWNHHLFVSVKFEQEEIEEGNCVRIIETAENQKLLPIPALTLKFQLDKKLDFLEKENTARSDQQYRNDCITVMSYQRTVRIFTVTGTRRGYYRINQVNLVAVDLLYRSLMYEDRENHSSVYVYPGHCKVVGLEHICNQIYGTFLRNSMLYEDPFEFRGIRDYTSHDPVKKMNWKASAKTGSLMVNQYYDTFSQNITLFLNVKTQRILDQEDLTEESIRIVRDCLEEFMEKEIPLQVYTNGVDVVSGEVVQIEPGLSGEHMDVCLRQLARIRTGDDLPDLVPIMEAHRQEHTKTGVSVLISHNQSETLVKQFADHVGDTGSGVWIVPIHSSMVRYLEENGVKEHLKSMAGNRIEIHYLVMEQID